MKSVKYQTAVGKEAVCQLISHDITSVLQLTPIASISFKYKLNLKQFYSSQRNLNVFMQYLNGMFYKSYFNEKLLQLFFTIEK